jgi:hypothetical protein
MPENKTTPNQRPDLFRSIAEAPRPKIWPQVVVALVLVAVVVGYKFDEIARLFR